MYGLFNGAPIAAAPVISPNGGIFGGTQNVTLSSATASANIYYTLDGTVPTPASTLYTGPITISTDTTIRAIASGAGFIQSAVSSATFTSLGPDASGDLPAGAGTLHGQHRWSALSDTDTAATIYYTTDGSTPTASSNLIHGSDRGHGLNDNQGSRHRSQLAEQ